MKHAIRKSALITLGVLLVLCSAAMPSSARVSEASSSVQDRSRTRQTRASISTLTLANKVRSELLKLPYYSVSDWIEYDVRPGGTVILRGYVTSPPDKKSRAEDRVKDIEGVTRVVNNIEVLPVSPMDDRLRRALYRAIYSGPLFRYGVGSLDAIHIVVKNGRATLYGVVDSQSDRQLAYMRARSVPGLFEVNNRLVVRGRNR